MSLGFDLSTTGALSWAAYLSDPSGSFAGRIAATSAARQRLRVSLKAARRASDARDNAGVAKAADDYLPYLLGVMTALDSDVLLLKSEPSFSWRTMVSASGVKGPPRVDIASTHYELIMVLLTYALALANLASSNVLALGDYERQRHTSEAERKRLDELVSQSVDALTRAAGILAFVSEDAIPRWETSAGEGIKGRPADTTREVTGALSKPVAHMLCLADAERLAIRRLLTRAESDATVAPGPPLPRSHPAPALLAKLELNVHGLLDSARSMSKSHGNVLTSDLRRCLSEGRTLAAAKAYKWLGVDAGEAGRVGEGVAWLQLAKSTLDELGKGGTLGSLKASKRPQPAIGGSADEAIAIEAFLKAYTRLNDKVSFQEVPKPTTLLGRVPSGRAALAAKPFALPAPRFGTSRTVARDDEADALAALSLDAASDSDDDARPAASKPPTARSGYF